jgi:hypothetical protein
MAIYTTDQKISMRPVQVLRLITEKFKTMADIPPADRFLLRRSKHKAITTLLPYAIRMEQGGQKEMVDAISHVSRALELVFKWHRIQTHITAVFDESSPPSLDRAIALISPYIPWYYWKDTKISISRWAAAAAAVPYSEEVCQNVVDTLLWTSDSHFLLSHIPVNTWAWLKKRPLLPPVCKGRSDGSLGPIVHHVRGLGDIETLKSYLLLVWSEWDRLRTDGLTEMQISIREDFGGIGMWCHREDLINHLDYVQGQLDQGLEYFERHTPRVDEDDSQGRKGQYKYLKDVLVEVEKASMETLTRTPPGLTFSTSMLILADVFRIAHNICLCYPPSMSLISHLERSVFLPSPSIRDTAGREDGIFLEVLDEPSRRRRSLCRSALLASDDVAVLVYLVRGSSHS